MHRDSCQIDERERGQLIPLLTMTKLITYDSEVCPDFPVARSPLKKLAISGFRAKRSFSKSWWRPQLRMILLSYS